VAPHFRFERKLAREGFQIVAGVDEAGRGPLAGPVAAAAVVLDPRKLPKGLDDSKKLTPEARDELAEIIFASAIAVGVGFAPSGEIDRINIRQATHEAMRRALRALSVRPTHVLIDGNDLPSHLPCPGQTIIKGDAACLSIAAASIIAKVTRDRLMRRLDQCHPAYGFARHAGYGTKQHLDAITQHGPCEFHRISFAPMRVEETLL
jgi:ribonuclease HII